MFNNVPVRLLEEHKHLGIILDKQLTFTSHINSKLYCTERYRNNYLRKYVPRTTLFSKQLYAHIWNMEILYFINPREKRIFLLILI